MEINCYRDARRAAAYAKLEFPGTYYLAFRDLPKIIFEAFNDNSAAAALDFGCGAGRSTRFLQRLGFHAVGVDIAPDMLERAREIDPRGEYFLIENGSPGRFENGAFDIALSAFTFDNIPTLEKKAGILKELWNYLKAGGILINLVSAPEIYTNEWASFSTRDFPENKGVDSGGEVKIIITDIEDTRPVVDFLCTDEDYKGIFKEAGFELVKTCKPLGKDTDPFRWVNETKIAPWTIYVLKKNL